MYLYCDETGAEHCRELFNVSEHSLPPGEGMPVDPVQHALIKLLRLRMFELWAENNQNALEAEATVTDGKSVFQARIEGDVPEGQKILEGDPHALNRLDELIDRALDNVKTFPIVRTLDLVDFTEYAQEKQKGFEKACPLNELQAVALPTQVNYAFAYFNDPDTGVSERIDRFVVNRPIGLFRDQTMVASRNIEIQKPYFMDLENGMRGINSCFYLDGSWQSVDENTPLGQRLSDVVDDVINKNWESLWEQFHLEIKTCEAALPPKSIPGINELYEYEDETGQKIQAPLVNIRQVAKLNGRPLEDDMTVEMLRAVMLKEFQYDLTKFMLYESEVDPYKFERLRAAVTKTVAVTDGKEVFIARNNPNEADLAKFYPSPDPVRFVQWALSSTDVIAQRPVLNTIGLKKVLPFDCEDYEEELRLGDYLPNENQASQLKSRSK